MTTLSTKQKQFLKGLAHHLNPVVMLGGNGLTEGVLAEIENALNHHELIKVKVAGADRETKQLTNYRAYFGALSPKRRSKNSASTQITTKVRSFLTALFYLNIIHFNNIKLNDTTRRCNINGII